MNAKREYQIQARLKFTGCRRRWYVFCEASGRSAARKFLRQCQSEWSYATQFRVLARVPSRWKKVRL